MIIENLDVLKGAIYLKLVMRNADKPKILPLKDIEEITNLVMEAIKNNMDKTQLERGVWVTVTNGPKKGAAGKIKRVDRKKGTVCVEFDGGLVTNTFKTHTMSWDNVTVYDFSSDGYYQSPAMIKLLNSKKG
jgi:transcription antitermination factor NusG